MLKKLLKMKYFFISIFLFVPLNVFAWGPLVTTKDGSLSDLIKIIFKIARMILGITGSLALLMFVVGGIMLMISGGNSENVDKGKKIITGAVWGIVIVFTSWLIVNFIIIALTNGNLSDIGKLFGKPWNELPGK